MTIPTFDETRPHPYVDPVQANGGLTHQTPDATIRITVRNPITQGKAKRVNWFATANDLAEQLYTCAERLAKTTWNLDSRDRYVNRQEERIGKLETEIAQLKRIADAGAAQKLRRIQSEAFTTCASFTGNKLIWWLIGPRLRRSIRELAKLAL